MKAFGKFITLVVIALALSFAFAACGNNDDPVDTGVQPSDVVPPPADIDDGDGSAVPAEETPAISGIHAPRDLGGRTIIVASDWGNAMPFARIGYDEPDPATAGNYAEDRLLWENTNRVLREFNVNVEFNVISDDMMGVTTASIMAGDPVGDAIFLGGGQVLSAIMGDLIRPLSIIDLPGSDLFGPQTYAAINVEAFGEPWAWYYQMISPHIWFMTVNLDIINAAGVPNPVDLYNAGQWTWNAALDIMRTVTRDTTGDGLFDQWGLAGQPVDIFLHFLASNDAPMVDDDLNYAFDNPRTIETMEFMETIFREGLWQYDPVSGPDPGDWNANFWAPHAGQAALFPGVLWGIGGLGFEYAVVPFPTGPSNYSGSAWSVGWGGGLTIPHGSRWDPAEILMVSEEFLTWHSGHEHIQAELGLGWARGTFLTEEDVQRWASLNARSRTDIGRVVPYYEWVLGDFTGAFISQEMTVLQAVEAFRPERQEILDMFFGDFDGF